MESRPFIVSYQQKWPFAILVFLLFLMGCSDSKKNDDSITDSTPQGTYITGKILDTNAFANDGSELPVVGVKVRFIGEDSEILSNAEGVFVLENLEAGPKVIDFSTKTATPAPTGDSYAGFREKIVLTEGANDIVRPFYLPRIAADSLTMVDPAQETVVTNEEMGVSLTISSGSAKHENGELFTGQLSISEVPNALAPAALPEDLGPGLLFTVQPVGVTFEPAATLSIRNDRDNWPAGKTVNFWSLDPKLGVFAVVGVGQVSSDGSTIETLSGGVIAADWHTPLPPAAADGGDPNDNDPPCQNCCDPCANQVGSSVDLFNGRFRESIRLPAYISQGQARFLELIYASDRAYPVEIMVAAPLYPAATPIPNQISYEGLLNGVNQGYKVYLDGSTLDDSEDELFRVTLPLDGTNLATNAYVGQARITSHYTRSDVSGRLFQSINIVNDKDSEFGAGWRLMGLDRIYPATSGGVLLVDGQGMARRYVEPNGSGDIVTIISTADERPEVNALQTLLDEMGVAHQFRSSGTTLNTIDQAITRDDIESTSLFIVTGTNGVSIFGFGGLTDEIKRNVLDVLETAHELGVPLLFVGATLGPWTAHLAEADLSRFERLMGVRRETTEQPRGGGFGTIGTWRMKDATHPIFNGPFGTIAPDPLSPFPGGLGESTANLSPSIDQQADLGETVLVEEYWDLTDLTGFDSEILNDQAIFTHNNAISGAPALTITAAMPAQGSPPIVPILDSILKNSVSWLTNSVDTAPGQLRSPNGDSTVLTLHEDGTYTRKTKTGYVYTFDSNGFLQTETDRNNNTIAYTYDTSNHLISITDPVGKVTQLVYANGKLQTITDPANRVTSFTHDANGDLVTVIFPDQSTRKFTYDDQHLIVSQINQRGFANTYEYNQVGQAISSTQPDGSARSLTPAQSIGLIIDNKNSPDDPASVTRFANQLAEGQ